MPRGLKALEVFPPESFSYRENQTSTKQDQCEDRTSYMTDRVRPEQTQSVGKGQWHEIQGECWSCTGVTATPCSSSWGRSGSRAFSRKGLAVLLFSCLNVSQQCAQVAKKANNNMACIKNSAATSDLPLCSALVRLQLSAACSSGPLTLKRTLVELECVQ